VGWALGLDFTLLWQKQRHIKISLYYADISYTEILLSLDVHIQVQRIVCCLSVLTLNTRIYPFNLNKNHFVNTVISFVIYRIFLKFKVDLEFCFLWFHCCYGFQQLHKKEIWKKYEFWKITFLVISPPKNPNSLECKKKITKSSSNNSINIMWRFQENLLVNCERVEPP